MNLANCGGLLIDGKTIKVNDKKELCAVVEGGVTEAEVETMLEDYVAKDGAKVLSTNDFTNELKTKLDGVKVEALGQLTTTSKQTLVAAINELVTRIAALESAGE